MQRPKYCPNPNCEFHSAAPAEQNWCHVAGRYTTKLRGSIVRFKCLACGRTFSERTFNLDYYTKRNIPYQHILQLMHTHGSMRKTARILGVSHQAISHRLQRLARLSIIE